MALRTAATLVLVVFAACFSAALEVDSGLVGGYRATSQSTDLPALAGARTVPAAR